MTRSAGNDFDHLRIAAGHPIRPHVLYRITRPEAWGGVPRGLERIGRPCNLPLMNFSK